MPLSTRPKRNGRPLTMGCNQLHMPTNPPAGTRHNQRLHRPHLPTRNRPPERSTIHRLSEINHNHSIIFSPYSDFFNPFCFPTNIWNINYLKHPHTSCREQTRCFFPRNLTNPHIFPTFTHYREQNRCFFPSNLIQTRQIRIYYPLSRTYREQNHTFFPNNLTNPHKSTTFMHLPGTKPPFLSRQYLKSA